MSAYDELLERVEALERGVSLDQLPLAGLRRALIENGEPLDLNTVALQSAVTFVQSPNASLQVIRGEFNSNAVKTAGEGFTVARTPGGNAVGDYTITFTTPFVDSPVIITTIGTSWASTMGQVAESVGRGPTSARIWTGSGGALADPGAPVGVGSVFFLVIGARA